jgi:hypothetical protein
MMGGNYFPILMGISSKGYRDPIFSILLFLSGSEGVIRDPKMRRICQNSLSQQFLRKNCMKNL